MAGELNGIQVGTTKRHDGDYWWTRDYGDDGWECPSLLKQSPLSDQWLMVSLCGMLLGTLAFMAFVIGWILGM